VTDEPIAESDNPIEDVLADDAREAKRGRYGWLSLVVAALFGLFYAYDLWEAVSPFVALPAFYDAFGYGSENVPWWLLWIGVLIPPAVFAVAFGIGARLNVLGKFVVFLVGLAVVAAASLGIVALEDVLRPEIIVVSGTP
jgi:hypothetical protein